MANGRDKKTSVIRADSLDGDPVADTPIDTGIGDTPETPVGESPEDSSGAGLGQVMDALDAVDIGEDTPVNPAKPDPKAVAVVDPALALMRARVTAAMATGSMAEGVEFFLKPVKISETQREEFMQALTPVLLKNNGTMPQWLADIIDGWKDELVLARKTIAIGYAIYEQRRDYQAAQQEKPRVRVSATMEAA